MKREDSEMAQLPPALEAPSQLVGGSKGEPVNQFWCECWEENRGPGEGAIDMMGGGVGESLSV